MNSETNEKMVELIKRVWEGERMAQEWRTDIISLLHKKGDRIA